MVAVKAKPEMPPLAVGRREIKVTPEMLRAGAEVLERALDEANDNANGDLCGDYESGSYAWFENPEAVAKSVYTAMVRAAPRARRVKAAKAPPER